MILSTKKRECTAHTEVTRDVIYLQPTIRAFTDPGREARAVTIFEDNDGAMKLLADNPICTNRTKHIDVRVCEGESSESDF